MDLKIVVKKRLQIDEIMNNYGHLTTNEFIYRCLLGIRMRGSPSLVGREIANFMFARTRGFESLSPRH